MQVRLVRGIARVAAQTDLITSVNDLSEIYGDSVMREVTVQSERSVIMPYEKNVVLACRGDLSIDV
jgi:hypothetical protein